MFGIPTVQQYNNAYPQLQYDQPPCPQNGYGWHGNGYGWQLNPEDWKTAPIYPRLNDAEAEDVPTPEAVEEPPIMEQKISKQNAYFGEKGSGFKTKAGGPQDFYKIREEHLKSGTLFEDPEFPATNYSLFASDHADRYFQWKRPGEISSDPQLFVEGFSRFDVQQGELGDCWLLAATANLTMYKRLFFQIVPDDQGFGEDYAGIFHFRFWQYGRWVDIVVDDRLPTDGGKLVYLHSTEENEFWSALLEKAYAKLHGSYEALKGGSTCEAMEDFTGGVTEMYELENSPPNLFKILDKAFERASLMGCSLEPDPNVLEAETSEGLIRGHAYSITKVVYLDIATPNVSGKIPLLRLRNPWGNESEWNGPWSDGAPEWKYISEEDKKRLGLIFDNDGEFFMSFKDWEKHFDRLEICNLNPDSLSENETKNKKKWEMSIFEGAWVRGVTAGGCRNFLETFWNNPQYRITLTEVDDDDEDNKCTCIVALMQKNRRQIKTSSGEELLTIGFAIYYLPNPDRVPKPLDMNFFKYNASVARSPSFINLREVSCRFKLPPGTYCIVPSTYDANDQGEFLLRVFSEHQNNMQYGGPSYPISDTTRYNDTTNEVEDDDEDRGYSGNRYRRDEPTFPGYDGGSSFHRSSFPRDPFRSLINEFFQTDLFGSNQPARQPNPPYPSSPSAPQQHPDLPYPTAQSPAGQHTPYNYPPPSSPSAYPQGGYPTPQSTYPSSHSSYPPNQGGYPTQGGYPGQASYPSQGGYPAQGGYPPQTGYPPQSSFPPHSGYPQAGYNSGYPQSSYQSSPYGGYQSQPQYSSQNHPSSNREEKKLEPITNLFKNLFKEHDDTVGYKDVDERISTSKVATIVKAAPPTKKSQNKVSVEKASDFELKRKEKSVIDFNHLAGEDGEVDYLELRQLLNKNFQSAMEGRGKSLQTTTSRGNDLFCHMYALCCGLLNKNQEVIEKAKTDLLSELRGTQFSKEVCRCMVAMLDTDYSGKLGDDEFKELWDLIMLWEKAFFLYDVDNSGALSGFELRNALGAAGYRLTNHVLNILMHRYGNADREITFDEFILCAVRLKTMIDKFQQRERQNVIILSREEWMESTLYC